MPSITAETGVRVACRKSQKKGKFNFKKFSIKTIKNTFSHQRTVPSNTFANNPPPVPGAKTVQHDVNNNSGIGLTPAIAKFFEDDKPKVVDPGLELLKKTLAPILIKYINDNSNTQATHKEKLEKTPLCGVNGFFKIKQVLNPNRDQWTIEWNKDIETDNLLNVLSETKNSRNKTSTLITAIKNFEREYYSEVISKQGNLPTQSIDSGFSSRLSTPKNPKRLFTGSVSSDNPSQKSFSDISSTNSFDENDDDIQNSPDGDEQKSSKSVLNSTTTESTADDKSDSTKNRPILAPRKNPGKTQNPKQEKGLQSLTSGNVEPSSASVLDKTPNSPKSTVNLAESIRPDDAKNNDFSNKNPGNTATASSEQDKINAAAIKLTASGESPPNCNPVGEAKEQYRADLNPFGDEEDGATPATATAPATEYPTGLNPFGDEEDVGGATDQTEYPTDLNPFGDEEDVGGATDQTEYPTGLNPFGDEEDGATPAPAPATKYPGGLNPFGDEEDGNSSGSVSAQTQLDVEAQPDADKNSKNTTAPTAEDETPDSCNSSGYGSDSGSSSSSGSSTPTNPKRLSTGSVSSDEPEEHLDVTNPLHEEGNKPEAPSNQTQTKLTSEHDPSDGNENQSGKSETPTPPSRPVPVPRTKKPDSNKTNQITETPKQEDEVRFNRSGPVFAPAQTQSNVKVQLADNSPNDLKNNVPTKQGESQLNSILGSTPTAPPRTRRQKTPPPPAIVADNNDDNKTEQDSYPTSAQEKILYKLNNYLKSFSDEDNREKHVENLTKMIGHKDNKWFEMVVDSDGAAVKFKKNITDDKDVKEMRSFIESQLEKEQNKRKLKISKKSTFIAALTFIKETLDKSLNQPEKTSTLSMSPSIQPTFNPQAQLKNRLDDDKTSQNENHALLLKKVAEYVHEKKPFKKILNKIPLPFSDKTEEPTRKEKIEKRLPKMFEITENDVKFVNPPKTPNELDDTIKEILKAFPNPKSKLNKSLKMINLKNIKVIIGEVFLEKQKEKLEEGYKNIKSKVDKYDQLARKNNRIKSFINGITPMKLFKHSVTNKKLNEFEKVFNEWENKICDEFNKGINKDKDLKDQKENLIKKFNVMIKNIRLKFENDAPENAINKMAQSKNYLTSIPKTFFRGKIKSRHVETLLNKVTEKLEEFNNTKMPWKTKRMQAVLIEAHKTLDKKDGSNKQKNGVLKSLKLFGIPSLTAITVGGIVGISLVMSSGIVLGAIVGVFIIGLGVVWGVRNLLKDDKISDTLLEEARKKLDILREKYNLPLTTKSQENTDSPAALPSEVERLNSKELKYPSGRIVMINSV